MLISVHIITAAGLGFLTKNPLAAFGVGVVSHFLGDKIPHWEYSVKPLDVLKDKKGFTKLKMCFMPSVLWVLSFIGLEILGGFLFIGLATFGKNDLAISAALFGGLGGLLPDILWGIADNSKNSILRAYRRFHHASHTKIGNVALRYGLTWQLALVGLAYIILHK